MTLKSNGDHSEQTMSANIIDGKKVAENIRKQVREDVKKWVQAGNRKPFLQVIQVGSDPGSTTYIGAKTRACRDVGIATDTDRLPDTISGRELKRILHGYNDDPDVDGILVQLPLPSHLSSHDVIESIDYRKDVDGFHPFNLNQI